MVSLLLEGRDLPFELTAEVVNSSFGFFGVSDAVNVSLSSFRVGKPFSDGSS